MQKLDLELERELFSFIETNIDLIDTNNWDEFINKVEHRFASWKAAMLYKIIQDADVNILKHINYIPHSFFKERQDLKIYIIPDNIVKIEAEAFTNCTSLEALYIPKSVHVIGMNTFKFCKNLKEIFYLGSREEYSYIEFQGFYSNPTQNDTQIVKLYCNDKVETFPQFLRFNEADFDF